MACTSDVLTEGGSNDGASLSIPDQYIVGTVSIDCIYGHVYSASSGAALQDGSVFINSQYLRGPSQDVSGSRIGPIDFNALGRPIAGMLGSCTVAAECPFDASGRVRTNGSSAIGAFVA